MLLGLIAAGCWNRERSMVHRYKVYNSYQSSIRFHNPSQICDLQTGFTGSSASQSTPRARMANRSMNEGVIQAQIRSLCFSRYLNLCIFTSVVVVVVVVLLDRHMKPKPVHESRLMCLQKRTQMAFADGQTAQTRSTHKLTEKDYNLSSISGPQADA